MMKLFVACVIALTSMVTAAPSPTRADVPSAQALFDQSLALMQSTVHSVHTSEIFTAIAPDGSSSNTMTATCRPGPTSMMTAYTLVEWTQDASISSSTGTSPDGSPLAAPLVSTTDVVLKWSIGNTPLAETRWYESASKGAKRAWFRVRDDMLHALLAKSLCPGSPFFLHVCQDDACTSRNLNPLFSSLTNLGLKRIGKTLVWDLEETTPEAQPEWATRVDYYLSQATLRPKKLVIASLNPIQSTIAIYNYSAYNKPVTIKFPTGYPD